MQGETSGPGELYQWTHASRTCMWSWGPLERNRPLVCSSTFCAAHPRNVRLLGPSSKVRPQPNWTKKTERHQGSSSHFYALIKNRNQKCDFPTTHIYINPNESNHSSNNVRCFSLLQHKLQQSTLTLPAPLVQTSGTTDMLQTRVNTFQDLQSTYLGVPTIGIPPNYPF